MTHGTERQRHVPGPAAAASEGQVGAQHLAHEAELDFHAPRSVVCRRSRARQLPRLIPAVPQNGGKIVRARRPLIGIRAAAVACAVAACGGVEAAALGEEVDVGYIDPTTSAATTLALTVLEVRQGTVEELEAAGLEFDPEERELVPHYVDARYANAGEATVERTMRVSVEDGDGNLISPTVVFDFSGGDEAGGPCRDTSDGDLPPGESFEDCTLFLVPDGVTVDRVSFLSQTPDEEPDFVYWQAE